MLDPQLIPGEITSDLVPPIVQYYALLPVPDSQTNDPVPLILNLHGGGGSREALKEQAPKLVDLMKSGSLPPVAIVTPTVTTGSFYMDFKDGSQQWESFIIGPFLDHLRERFRLRTDRQGTLLTGVSMGGMGSLRLAFKHPDLFGAVAALEPAIEPVDKWHDMREKHNFWRAKEFMHEAFGSPIDAEYWEANNPASIASKHADEIRKSGLKIFLEVGDEDSLWLYEGAEFLHQALWNQKIRHEYRLYYGADHVGRSLESRSEAAFRFLAKTLQPIEPDPDVDGLRRQIAPVKRALNEGDHYGNDSDLLSQNGDQ